MKRLIQLAPRLSGVGAALFAGSALAAQMYLNPLAGDTTVDKGTYGAVTADVEAGIEAYAGLTLPAPIAATSFSTKTSLGTTGTAVSGNITGIIVDGTHVVSHTVAGWFKIDSLPSSGNYQMLWAARSAQTNAGYNGDHGGYRVCVTPTGELAIGKITTTTTTLDNFKTDGTNEPVLSSGAGIEAGKWYHIAVAVTADLSDTRNKRGTPTFFVNGKQIAIADGYSTFKINLAGNKCGALVTGMGISAAGFYVDGTAITEAATIRSLAVNPAKNIYVDRWTRAVPGNDGWHPNVATNYYWSGERVDASAVQPLVYRGSVTLNVTATSDSTLTLNASPSLTALTTAYGESGTAVLTLASGSNTLTATTTTISAQTVLSGTGFSLGTLFITSTGTLTVGDNRTNFTVTSIDEGGKLIVTPTATEIANGRITFNVGESVTLSTENVEVTGYNTFTATGGTITLPIPTWTPTTEDTSWNAHWTNAESAPTSGTVILDLSNLTAAQTVTIPASVNLSTTSIIGASESVPVTIESGASLGALTVSNQATLPANLPASSVILQSGAILSLTGDGTIASVISGAGALRIASGTTTLSQANTYTGGTTIETGATVVLGNATALGTAANVTGGGTIESASLPACNLTATGWTGTLRLTADIDGNGMDWSAYGNANSTFEIPTDVDISGYFSASAWTLRAKVILNGSITINNGSSTNSYTFTGPLSGSGTFSLTTANATIAVLLQDVTAFTGTLSTSTVKKTFIVGTGHTYNSSNDGGKIVIAGTLTSDAVRNWSADYGIVVEGTLTTSLSEEETTAGYTLSGVTVASGGKVRFVRPDKWVVEETSNVYDPDTAVFADATWTGSGDDTNWTTVANWSCNGQTVTTAPGTSLASLNVAAGKTITLPGAVTVESLTTSGAFTLGGAADTSLTAKAVTLGGAVTLNAPLVLNLTSALTTDKAITVSASGALTTKGTVSLTNAGCAFSGPLTVESGSLTWQHNGNDKTISGAVTVKEGATFATAVDYKYALTLSGALSGAGTVRVKVPTAGSQHDGARFLNLQGACADFTGTVELEMTVTGATSNGETMPRRTSVVIKPSDHVFNGSIDVVKVAGSSPFADTDTAVSEGLWPYSKIFFANNCTFTGTIGGQGTVYIGRTGDRDNTKLLADNGDPSTTAGAVTLKGTLGDVVTTNGDTTATFAGQIFVAGEDTTTEGSACPAASVAFTTTTKQVFSGALTGAGWKTFGVEGNAGTFEVSGTFGEAVADDAHGYDVKHTGGITIAPGSSLTMAMTKSTKFAGALSSDGKSGAALVIASGKSVALSAANGNYSGTITVEELATLSNAGSSQAIPFGKGTIENKGTVKLMGTTGDWGSGQLPPTSGSGKITFCAGSTSRIPGEITTTGTITFEGTTEKAAAAVVTFIKNATDFSGKVASIHGASVVVGEGVTLAKGEASSPLITIAANRSLSGTGTINVPVTFENDTKATMASNASLTFGSTLTVPKNVTLPGTINLASTAVLSGAGILSGAVSFAEGATIDATASTVEQMLTFTSTPTFAATIPVKVAGLCSLFSVPKTVNLTAEQVSLTWAESAIAGSEVMLLTVFETTMVRLFVPPTVSVSEDPESPRDAGVDEAITKAAETWAQQGMVISEVTAITATGTDGKSTRDVNAAALFDGVLSLTPGTSKGDGTCAATATVTYDFGVSDITVKSANLSDNPEAAAQLYVLVCAKVSNGNEEDATAADYAGDTTVSLLLGDKVCDGTEGNGPKATELSDGQLTALNLPRGKGKRWFAVPVTSLKTVTNAFSVRASNTTQAEATP